MTRKPFPTFGRPTMRETDLEAMAARLWPWDAGLRARWLNAVALVRRTDRGWLLDKPVQRRQEGPRHARPR